MNEESNIIDNNKRKYLLLEGAYIQSPTFPGFWVKYEDVRERFNRLVKEQGLIVSEEFDTLFTAAFPQAKFEDSYQTKDSQELFRAVKIIPKKLVGVNSLKKEIENAYNASHFWKGEWKNFASIGNTDKELKAKCVAMGFTGTKHAVECLLKNLFVFKTGDTSKREPPLLISKKTNSCIEGLSLKRSDIPESITACTATTHISNLGNSSFQPYKVRNIYRELLKNPSVQNGWVKASDLMNGVNWTGCAKEFTSKYNLQVKKINLTLFVRISNISRFEILDDIYFDSQRAPYQENIAALKVLALKEPWEDDNKPNGLLDNYICYTYSRVKEEGKISLSQDGLHGCWNTGLVDYRYESIYCYMTRRTSSERWVFKGFCIDGEDLGKVMASHISILPKRALYFNNCNLLFEPDSEKLTVDADHIIKEHPSRLPKEWITRALRKTIDKDENESLAQYDLRLGEEISNDREALAHLHLLLERAVNIALLRCQWNYKTAIPYYDPNAIKNGHTDNIGWFLPLCISKDQEYDPFAALVVTKLPSGRYQGQTIYKLSWAYRCARLVCRPDSDWLSPSPSFAEEEIEEND